MNFVPCRLELRDGTPTADFGDGRILPLPPPTATRPWCGREMILGLRPEHLSRAEGAAPRPGQVPLAATIDLVQPTGTRAYATFRLGGAEVTAELPAHAVERPGTELRPAGRHRAGDPDRPAERAGRLTGGTPCRPTRRAR